MTGLDRKKVYRTASSRQSIFNSARSSRRKQFSRLERRKKWKIVSSSFDLSVHPRKIKNQISLKKKKKKGGVRMYSIEEKTGKNCPEKFTLNTRHSCPKRWTKRKKRRRKDWWKNKGQPLLRAFLSTSALRLLVPPSSDFFRSLERGERGTGLSHMLRGGILRNQRVETEPISVCDSLSILNPGSFPVT